MNNFVSKKLFPIIIIVSMVLSLAGCGKSGGDAATNSGKTDASASVSSKTLSDYVYLAEDLEGIETPEGGSMSNVKYVNGKLYFQAYILDPHTGDYNSDLYCFDIEAKTTTKLPKLTEEEDHYISGYMPDKDGSIYAVDSVYDEEKSMSNYILKKFDKDGKVIFETPIREEMADVDGDYFYVEDLYVLGSGKVVVGCNSCLLVFDENGSFAGNYNVGNYIMGSCINQEGDLVVASYTEDYPGVQAIVFDAEKRNAKSKTPNIAIDYIQGITCGIDGRYYVRNGNSVCTLNFETGEVEKLFNWLDNDISGDYIQDFFQMNNGDFLALGNNYDTGESICTKLVKTERSAVPQKTELVVGMAWTDSTVLANIISFNKSSDKYHVTVRDFSEEYAGNDNLSTTDVMTRALTEDDCPDLMDLSYVDIDSAVEKGAFVDLNEFLNSSTEVNRDMFVDSLLNAYTFDNKLMGIPLQFYVYTVLGRSDVVGEKEGWTIDEVMELIKNNPDKKIMLYDQRDYVMNFFCPFILERYVDMENKTCNFTDDSFKTFLEIMAMFPEKFDEDSIDYNAYASYYRSGEIMIEEVYISDFEELQMYEALMGGDITTIGFPTADGTPTSQINASQCYGISTKSANKEGAWELIQYLCTHAEARQSYNFSSFKDRLEEQIAEATKSSYVTDENGELVLDDDGNPIQESYRSTSWGDWTYDYRPATQEEVDRIKHIIDCGRIAPSFNGDLLKIMEEEAAAYYKKQKSIDDVCNTIQSRVSIYLMENAN